MRGFRTDLAMECIDEGGGRVEGVRVSTHHMGGITHTRIRIEKERAAELLGRHTGEYITLEYRDLPRCDAHTQKLLAALVAQGVRSLLPREGEVLVVGLGNRDVTADALGPEVVDNLFINRHVVLEYGKAAYGKEKMNLISSLVPGVTAMTGMETAEIIKGVVEQTQPDVVLVVDALAARSTKRLNRTIQISDTGIHPGSGVGNHRNAITRESLGIPVIAIGVPTVVDAATIVGDAIESMIRENGEKNTLFHRDHPKAISELNNMYVTSKDIDETVKRLSFTISEAINIALQIA